MFIKPIEDQQVPAISIPDTSVGCARRFWLLLLHLALLIPAQGQAQPGLLADVNLQVPVRDGISLSVDIYRPDGDGPYPALYAAGPFPHHQDNSPPDNAITGPVAWYVEQGYAVVLASSRGTGLSQGSYGFLSRDEQQDHYELIEWIAAQPWSSGRVAGYGAGYYASSQWMMAVQSPPSLACIAPFNGVLDPYRDWAYPGGLANSDFTMQWYDREVRQINAYPPSGPGRLVDFDLRYQQLQHPLIDDFWLIRSARSNLQQIRIPVFAVRSLEPGQPGARTALRSMLQLSSANKLLVIGQSEDSTLYGSAEFHAREILPFYEWCLGGNGNSYIERPRVRWQVGAQETIKRDSSWPPGNMMPTPLFLSSSTEGRDTGIISFSQSTVSSRATGLAENGSIEFVSEPLVSDMELTGPVMLELYASTTTGDMAFAATLEEEIVERRISAPPGEFPSFLQPELEPAADLMSASRDLLVSTGVLKASMRALSPEQGSEMEPWYNFESSDPLRPGQIYRLDLAMDPVAYRFGEGNRIRLTIHPAQDPSIAMLNGRETVYHTPQYPSRLWLPLVRTGPELTTPTATPASTTPNPGQNRIDAQSLFNDDSPVIFIP